MSLRDQILDFDDEHRETVQVPMWGNVEVELRSMNGAERSRFFDETRDATGKVLLDRFYPMIVVLTTYDPTTGERIFSDADAAALNLKSASALEFLAAKALRLSGINEGAVDAAGNGS